MSKIAFIFPGQGSQAVGMGQDICEGFDWAADLFSMAEDVTGLPIKKLCFEGPMEELTQTVNLQPALTTVNLACFQALTDKGVSPDFTAGHSLGEYSALAAAGVLTAEDALRLVFLRGKLMQRDADKRPGAMQAVMGLEASDVEAIAELARDRGIVVVANHNTPQQLVITGEGEAVATAAKLAKQKGGKAIPLKVSGAWHSPLMKDAATDFAKEVAKTEFMAPSRPIVLNVTGKPETDPAAIKEAMTRQIISPVKWCDSILSMLDAGVNVFVEAGPKNVLAGLVKKTAPKDAELNIMNAGGLESIAKAAETLGKK